jgi:hypothetical protein
VVPNTMRALLENDVVRALDLMNEHEYTGRTAVSDRQFARLVCRQRAACMVAPHQDPSRW